MPNRKHVAMVAWRREEIVAAMENIARPAITAQEMENVVSEAGAMRANQGEEGV